MYTGRKYCALKVLVRISVRETLLCNFTAEAPFAHNCGNYLGKIRQNYTSRMPNAL